MKKLDFHVHFTDESISVEESARYFNDMCERKGYEGVGLIAASFNSFGEHPDCNERALKLKSLIPGSFAFAALHRDRDFVEQTEAYMSDDFHGIKLIGGKPSQYRHFGYGYEHERYEPLFAYCEKYGVPLLIHNNDPLSHWDVTKASPRAIARGWVYDETLPSQAWFFEVMEDIFARHPRLKVALAHLGFYANDLDRAERLLEAYPNLVFDITPALVIFDELSENPARAEAFFRKYHDRLIFGTDASNNLVGEARAYNDVKTDIVATFLMGDAPLDTGNHRAVPIHLEPEMIENIYYHNALRFIGGR